MRRSGVSGFTLIEALVTIGVVGVVLALALPAVGKARARAEAERCRATLRSIGQGSAIVASDRRGVWPNQFMRNEPWVQFSVGAASYWLTPVQQESLWPGAYVGSVWDSERGDGDWHCRGARRYLVSSSTYFELPGGSASFAIFSYYQSVALFTDPALWDPDHPERRLTPTRFARPVRIDEVQFPSAKVASAERAPWHDADFGAGRSTWDTNALFVDGHVRRVNTGDATPALPLFEDWGPNQMRDPVPFSSAPWGVRGVDFR